MKTTTPPPSIDLVFRALSDRTRLRILGLLRGGELCVCDIVTVLQVPQPMASRHLAYLRRAGLVKVRRQGHWIFYRRSTPAGKARRTLLASLPDCIDELSEAKDDARRLARGCETPNCCD